MTHEESLATTGETTDLPPKLLVAMGGLGLIAVLAAVDYLLDPEISLSVF